jgi:RNA polymerase sigma-70 factor (ECF subfamily)
MDDRGSTAARGVAAPTDEALALAVRAGDTASLGVLAARWQRPLHRFVDRLLPHGDDAHDVCQETFLRILRRADGYREGGRFSTWMYQIALNLCRDRRRKRRRWSAIVADGVFDDDDPSRFADRRESRIGPEQAVERGELQRLVGRALDRIPADQREVVVLKEFEGLRFREIAEIVGAPESTVKSRMYYGLRGLRGLRAALEREGYDATDARRARR